MMLIWILFYISLELSVICELAACVTEVSHLQRKHLLKRKKKSQLCCLSACVMGMLSGKVTDVTSECVATASVQESVT